MCAASPYHGHSQQAHGRVAGARTECIREGEAPSSAPFVLCTQRPGFRKDPGLVHFTLNRPCIGTGQRSMDRATAGGGRSLTSCRKAASGTWIRPTACPATSADVAQQAEQGHAMAKAWVRDPSSAPLRVCPCTPWPRDRVLVVRDVRGPWPDTVQRDTTSGGMLALGHSRSGGHRGLARCQNREPRGPRCGAA